MAGRRLGARVAQRGDDVLLYGLDERARVERTAVDGRLRMEELVCDGALVSTPAGSTAYNLSAHGPILPINAQLLALTPISPFRPRRWRGALLPYDAKIRIEVLEPTSRVTNAAADHTEVAQVASVDIFILREKTLQLMFDPDHNLDERILLLTGSAEEMNELVRIGAPVSSVNVGGLHFSAGKKEMLPFVFVDEPDLKAFGRLLDMGTTLSLHNTSTSSGSPSSQ